MYSVSALKPGQPRYRPKQLRAGSIASRKFAHPVSPLLQLLGGERCYDAIRLARRRSYMPCCLITWWAITNAVVRATGSGK